MDTAFLQSSVTLFEILCVIIVFASILLRSRFFKEVSEGRPSWTTQSVLIIFFGFMSIFGTLSGITIYGAVVNIRDLGPMAGGLIGGPLIGIGSGIIGGLFRFGQGGPYMWTGLSAPILSGFLGSLLYLANRRRFVPAWIAVVYIGLSETLISCYTLILVTKPPEFVTVLSTVAIPMIVFNVIGMIIFAAFVNHTLREQEAQRALQALEREVESRRNLSAIINTIAYPVYVLDRNHRFTLVNDNFCRFIGQEREKLLGMRPDDFFSPTDSRTHHEMTESVFLTKIPREDETLQTLPDGQQHALISTATPYADAAGQEFMVGILQDITERRKMQDALAESEAWYRTLFEHTGAATIIINQDSTIGQVNSEFVALTGYTREEIEGKMSWKQFAHPDDLELIRRYHRDRLVDPSAAPTTYAVRMRDRHGNIRTLHAVVAVIPGTKRSIASYVDISERKKAEETLTLVNKKLNLLSSITRHDILNQLMILNGFLALLRKKITDPGLSRYIERGSTAVRNIEHQIVFTRDYQDMGIREPAWQNIRNTVVNAKGALPMGEVTVETEQPDWEVYADPLFEKVFYNLIDNSLRYGGNGMKHIRISSKDSGNGLTITYEDDGVGIEDPDRIRLFERGFGKHSGFGLFLSREILSITGITVEESGSAGSGAQFTMHVARGGYRPVSTGSGSSQLP